MKLLLDWSHMKLENKDGMALHRSAGDLKFALDLTAVRTEVKPQTRDHYPWIDSSTMDQSLFKCL
jgi:hypothetical protein